MTRDNDVKPEDLHAKKREKEENDAVARLLRPYAAILVKYPSVVVVIVVIVVALSGVLGFVSGAGAKDLPDFSEPTRGFEARGTTIAARRVTLRNFFVKIGVWSSRKRRDVTNLVFNGNTLKTKFVLIYEHVDQENLFTYDHMKSICESHKQKIVDFPYYNSYFKTPAHHLPNYIARLNGHSSCDTITKANVDTFFQLLKNCKSHFYQFPDCAKDSSKCSVINATCRTHPSIPNEQDMATLFHNVFYFLTDKDFVGNVNSMKQAAVIEQLANDYGDAHLKGFAKPLYEKSLKDLSETKYKNVKIVAYNIEDFKFEIFQDAIILQLLFIVTAIVLVILFIWFYSGSLFIGLMTVACVLIASIVAYFVYGRVFDMDFYPFLNMVTIIFIVGIGADDAFVYTGVWEEAKRIYVIKNPTEHVQYMIKWTIHSLRHASLAMFVTSFTTASAFYANMTSGVTSVKCFGLYSGTAIIIMYLLMITFFPVAVILHEKYFARCMHYCCPGFCKTRPQIDDDMTDRDPNKMQMAEPGVVVSMPKKSNPVLTKIWETLEKASYNMFEKYLPLVIYKLRFVWCILLLLIGIGGIVVTFAEPGLNPPSSNDFQMFTSSSSLEKYDLKFKKKFHFGFKASGNNEMIHFILNVKAVDSGNKFEPTGKAGSVSYHVNSMDLSKHQVWLVNFCTNLTKQSFYISSRTCTGVENYVRSLQQSCFYTGQTCCGLTWPLPKATFDDCLYQSRFQLSNIEFNQRVVKSFYLDAETNYQYSENFDFNKKLFNSMETWFNKEIATAGSDDFKGFWYMTQDFYDLQNSLFASTKESLGISIAVAFIIILLTTWNIFLSLYSILTITFIISVTVGILILSGWRLNIMESVVFSVAAGLSADFTLHYSVAYKTSLQKDNRVERVNSALAEIGPAILMGAFTTFVAGLAMTPSTVLVYIQMAQFLMLVMTVSWVYSTFFFLSTCALIGPTGNFGQLSCPKKKSEMNVADGNDSAVSNNGFEQVLVSQSPEKELTKV